MGYFKSEYVDLFPYLIMFWQCKGTPVFWVYNKECVDIVDILVTVIVVFVVASQSSQRPQTDGVGEEDLGASIHPHLTQKTQFQI